MRIVVKNVLSHYYKLTDYHYPPGFHHVVSAVLVLLTTDSVVTPASAVDIR